MQRTCSIDDCERPRVSHGWCQMHHRRWKRTGDPLGLRVRPNAHSVSAEGVGLLAMTGYSQPEKIVRYDLADKPMIQSHHWRVLATGYTATNIGGRGSVKMVLLHRLILGLEAGDPRVGDHISGDITDFRRSNLRVVDWASNIANQAIANGRGTSRYRGVCWSPARKKWTAYSHLNGKRRALGYFANEEDAAIAVATFRRDNGLPTGY